MTRTLHQFLNEIRKHVQANPEILNYPVFINDTSSGIIEPASSVFPMELTEGDINSGCFDDDDIGRKIFAICSGE